MKILKVQIKCPDKLLNQHLVPGLYRSNLASCPAGKYSFIYLGVCLFHEYLLNTYYVLGIVRTLKTPW